MNRSPGRHRHGEIADLAAGQRAQTPAHHPLLLAPPPLALTKLTPAGNVSVTTTLLALDGPKFVTDIV